MEEVHLFFDGIDLGDFWSTHEDNFCRGKGVFEFGFSEPFPAYASPGRHDARIQLSLTNGTTVARHFFMDFQDIPAWFADPRYSGRSVYPSTYTSTPVTVFQGYLVPEAAQPSTIISEDIPNVGVQHNQGDGYSYLSEYYAESGTLARKQGGQIRTQALNTSAYPKSISEDRPGADNTLSFSQGPFTIIKSGRIPIYRDSWGIWPIASAQFGGDIWFSAEVSYSGEINFSPVNTSMLVYPSGTFGADVWLDASAILGLVKAEAHAIPQVSLGMPIHYTNGAMDDQDKCFSYRLDVSYYTASATARSTARRRAASRTCSTVRRVARTAKSQVRPAVCRRCLGRGRRSRAAAGRSCAGQRWNGTHTGLVVGRKRRAACSSLGWAALGFSRSTEQRIGSQRSADRLLRA